MSVGSEMSSPKIASNLCTLRIKCATLGAHVSTGVSRGLTQRGMLKFSTDSPEDKTLIPNPRLGFQPNLRRLMTRRVANMNLTQLLADLNVKDQVSAKQSLSSARNPFHHWKNGWDLLHRKSGRSDACV